MVQIVHTRGNTRKSNLHYMLRFFPCIVYHSTFDEVLLLYHIVCVVMTSLFVVSLLLTLIFEYCSIGTYGWDMLWEKLPNIAR